MHFIPATAKHVCIQVIILVAVATVMVSMVAWFRPLPAALKTHPVIVAVLNTALEGSPHLFGQLINALAGFVDSPVAGFCSPV